MAFKIALDPASSSLDVLIVAGVIKSENEKDITISWNRSEDHPKTNVCLYDKDGNILGEHNNEITRYLARTINPALYGDTCIERRTQIDNWISCAMLLQRKEKDYDLMNDLNSILISRTWLVGTRLTLADIHMFTVLHNQEYLQLHEKDYCNTTRWYKHMQSLPIVSNAIAIVKNFPLSSKLKDTKEKKQEKKSVDKQTKTRKQEGKFMELPKMEKGKVVVRFPPEASGYLHIGHAKAALLNQYYADSCEGKFILRFDDTNPAKETIEFEEAILEDLKLLQIEPDCITHTSDYFDVLEQYCNTLITYGKAYLDNSPADVLKEQRDKRMKSPFRDTSANENLAQWAMLKRGEEQEFCVRAKIDYESTNGCMRDPIIYRCKLESHPRTGDKYKVYPTYDFACPIVDSLENVTHTLRTTEYHDRDAQYYWIIDILELRRPFIWEYSRLNMTHTVLSKRKLTWFVNEGLVDGWDDPRFPTVRGILRRGMTVEGLKQFIISQGSSRSVVFMEWDKIWSFNKKIIDPVAVRYTALDYNEMIPVNVVDAKEMWLTVQNHPKDSSLGTKQVRVGPKVLIEKADAEKLVEGQNTTFINWGNLMILKVNKQAGNIVGVEAQLNLQDKNYKNTMKITWLAESLIGSDPNAEKSNPIKCYAVYFGHIMSVPVLGKDDDFKNFIAKDTRKEVQMLGEVELKRVKKGEIIQLQRKGFFICDVPYDFSPYSLREQPVILFHIPDGHATTPYMTPAVVGNQQDGKKNDSDEEIIYRNPLEKVEEIIAKCDKAPVLDPKHKEKIQNLMKNASEKLSIPYDAVNGTLKIPKNSLLYSPYLKEQYQQFEYNDILDYLKCLIRLYDNRETLFRNLLFLITSEEEWLSGTDYAQDITGLLNLQDDKVRTLKSSDVDKNTLEREMETLSCMKRYWEDNKPPDSIYPKDASKEVIKLYEKFKKQGNDVEYLKDIMQFEVRMYQCLVEVRNSVVNSSLRVESTLPFSKTKILPEDIKAQENLIRDLEKNGTDAIFIEDEKEILSHMKRDFKDATSCDWVTIQLPADTVVATQSKTKPESKEISKAEEISEEIKKQGDKIRNLKSSKADKTVIDQEVKILLNLKSDYKSTTGQDWKPTDTRAASTESKSKAENVDTSKAEKISEEIKKQGEKVRNLKSSKADKSVIDQEVKILLNLKGDYKSATGKDWKPIDIKAASTKSKSKAENVDTAKVEKISEEIKKQEDKIRNLNSVVDQEMKILLNLRGDYKSATGEDWKPIDTKVASTESKTKAEKKKILEEEKISEEIKKQGDKVRNLKGTAADKRIIDQEEKILFNLKSVYKCATGQDWKPANSDTPLKKEKQNSPGKTLEKGVAKNVDSKDADSSKTGTRLGLEAKKEDNFSDWYSQVITKSEMIEYYDVSGCYILRSWSLSIWKMIKKYIDEEISALGVEEYYYPIFVTRSVLEKEKTHIADFAPEVAWVTKCGETDLAEPIAIRPTSETVMYPTFAKWLKSGTELPLKVNQWNNVVRWEFKDPTPFLRTREFLWQEGHTAYATKEEAEEEVLTILDMYARVYEELLAVPVIKGRKTEKEKFAGGDYTTTVEAFISTNGRAIQGATSHHLGQNFSKMFNIQVEGIADGDEKTFVYQNSWGLTTRTIGVMIMMHGDDKGLVLPPKVAPIQVVVIPCGIVASMSESKKAHVLEEIGNLVDELKKYGYKVHCDLRSNRTPGWKFNHWELKGVPLRIEFGPRNIERNDVTIVRRDTLEREAIKKDYLIDSVDYMLEDIQEKLLSKAKEKLQSHIKRVENWSEFNVELNKKNLLLSPFCGEPACEENIKEDSSRENTDKGIPIKGVKSLCIPFIQPDLMKPLNELKCIHYSCKNKPKFYTLFGRSY